jgi:hypothetical protein
VVAKKGEGRELDDTKGIIRIRISNNKEDVNMDTVTNNSFLFIINSKTKHADGLFLNTKSV